MADEAGRYNRVGNARVDEVAYGFSYRRGDLYKPTRPASDWSHYGKYPIKGSFNTVEEALEAVRKAFDGR